MDDLSFTTWLQITGPTFAALVAGFTLLWTQSQTLSAQMLEVTRTLGRLDGSLAGLDARVGRLEATLERLDDRLDRLDDRLDALDSSLGKLDRTIEGLTAAILRLADTPRGRQDA